jgi:hypothetical protein
LGEGSVALLLADEGERLGAIDGSLAGAREEVKKGEMEMAWAGINGERMDGEGGRGWW